ncbi:hypothetical protein F4781DRAFT_317122 [Annulohypoxylon bovei var. microspora]|nr:hypothetical protein F4781DRAFT_317122 [Annulohypoxylon bovei var. microspora]
MRSAIIIVFLAGVVSSQSATVTPAPAQTAVDLFLGARRQSNYSFAASVVAVDDTTTTYEIRCKSGALNLPGLPTTTCDLKDPPWTVTEGPSTMIGVLSTAIQNVTGVLDETCTIEGRTAAYCNYTFVGDLGGKTTSTSYPTTITGENYAEYLVTITGGADKLHATTTTALAEVVSTSNVKQNRVRVRVLGTILLATSVFVIM